MTPGRPSTYVVTEEFLDHFGLSGLDALPGMDEMRSAGLLDARSSLDILGERREAALDDEDGDEEPLSEEEMLDPLRADFGDPALVSWREPGSGESDSGETDAGEGDER